MMLNTRGVETHDADAIRVCTTQGISAVVLPIVEDTPDAVAKSLTAGLPEI